MNVKCLEYVKLLKCEVCPCLALNPLWNNPDVEWFYLFLNFSRIFLIYVSLELLLFLLLFWEAKSQSSRMLLIIRFRGSIRWWRIGLCRRAIPSGCLAHTHELLHPWPRPPNNITAPKSVARHDEGFHWTHPILGHGTVSYTHLTLPTILLV